MLQYLEQSSEIARAQKRLEETLVRAFRTQAIKDIGWPGGRQRSAKLVTDGRYWFWSEDYRARGATPRRLNWFGTLSDKRGVAITVEVNTAYARRNNQTGGFFARDLDTNKIYLLHSGRVGGGAKGVGKHAFLAWATSNGQALESVVDTEGRVRRGLIVMPVEGAGAARSAIRYIDIVKRFKIATRSGALKSKKFRRLQNRFKDYYNEGRGHRVGTRSDAIDYVSRHGEIVDALHEWRKSKPMPARSRIVKDVLIDLGLARSGKLIELFEVKSVADRQNIYSALGQLMVHSPKRNCRRVIVLPKKGRLANDLVAALKRHNIETLRFRLNQQRALIL